MTVHLQLDSVKQMAEDYMEQDSFVVDVETVYVPTAEDLERLAFVESTKVSDRTIDDALWLEEFKGAPADPRRNTVHWIGFSTYGRSDIIPVGHPNGHLIKPARREKVHVVQAYGEGDPRTLTKLGRKSERMVWRSLPPVFAPPPPQPDIADVIEVIRPMFWEPSIRVVNHNLKFDLKTLSKYFGALPPGPYMDTMIAQHILDERLVNYQLDTLVKRHFCVTYEKLGRKGVQNYSFRRAASYNAEDVRYTWLLWQKLKRRYENNELFAQLLYEVEMRLYESLIRSEMAGVRVDVERIRELRAVAEVERDSLVEQLIVDYGAPTDFLPTRRAQVQELLYVTYKAPVVKRTEKTEEASTDADALNQLVDRGGKAAPVAKLLVDWAEQQKVISTYLVGLDHAADESSFIHPDFTQHAARTGRMSCREPNLHNIPRDSDLRNVFLPPWLDHLLIVGDYNQIELRLLGAHANDPRLCKLFMSGDDVHAATAAAVLSILVAEVTKDQRNVYGKTPNFLIGYGGGYELLAKKTGISKRHAREVLDDYHDTFSRIRPWMNMVVNKAKNKARWEGRGDDRRMVVEPYAETWLGRRRRLPELFWGGDEKADKIRSYAERQAANHVIQGSAAEILKLAVINLQDYLDVTGFPMQIHMNVHDELICSAHERHAEEGGQILKMVMEEVRHPWTDEHPMFDRVPLEAKVGVSDKWEKE